MDEALIAFVLVLVVTGVAPDKRVPPRRAPVAIGFALATGVLPGGPVTGGAGNPARAMGPMIVSGTWDTWLIYLIGPIVGGAIGALVDTHFVGHASPPTMQVADEQEVDGSRRSP